jgi:hypothetical protein
MGRVLAVGTVLVTLIFAASASGESLADER